MARKHFATVKMINNGRITIPADIRELEKIKDGDYIQISVEKIEEVNVEIKRVMVPDEMENGSQENVLPPVSQALTKRVSWLF